MSRGGAERGSHRIQSTQQAVSCQHRALHGAQTHKLRDHGLKRSQMLNQLSHPGAPLLGLNLRVQIDFAMEHGGKV